MLPDTLARQHVTKEVRYLSAHFTLTARLFNNRNFREIALACDRDQWLALKPWQKLDLLLYYVLPGYY